MRVRVEIGVVDERKYAEKSLEEAVGDGDVVVIEGPEWSCRGEGEGCIGGY